MAELFLYSRGVPEAPDDCWQDHVRVTEAPISVESGIPSSGFFDLSQHIPLPDFLDADGGLFDYTGGIATTATDAIAVVYDYDDILTTYSTPWIEFFVLDAGVYVPAQQIDVSTYGSGYAPVSSPEAVAISGEWAVANVTRQPAADYYADIIIYHKVVDTWEEAYVFSSQTQALTNYTVRGLDISPDAEYIMHGVISADGDPAYVLVYRRTGSAWAYHQTLSDPDAGGSFPDFGNSVALNNDTAVVGYSTNDVGGTNRGRAYVFTRSGTTWSYAQTLNRPTLSNSSYFGNSVAISETNRIVVADQKSRGYVFDYSEGVWSYTASLTSYYVHTVASTLVAISPDGLTVVLTAATYGAGQLPVYINEYTDVDGWVETQEIIPIPNYEGLSQNPSPISYKDGVVAIAWSADDVG